MIETFFTGPYLRQLDNIVQWSEIDVFQRESVSQHSFKVAIFTRVLLEDLFKWIDTGHEKAWLVESFKSACVDHALFHDFDEALIRRDISHATKYNAFNGDAIRKDLNDLARHLADAEFGDGSASGKMVLDSVLNPRPAVKAVVKLCDWLAMAFFIRRERRMGNENLHLEEHTVLNGIGEAVAELRKRLQGSEFEGIPISFDSLEKLIKIFHE